MGRQIWILRPHSNVFTCRTQKGQKTSVLFSDPKVPYSVYSFGQGRPSPKVLQHIEEGFPAKNLLQSKSSLCHSLPRWNAENVHLLNRSAPLHSAWIGHFHDKIFTSHGLAATCTYPTTSPYESQAHSHNCNISVIFALHGNCARRSGASDTVICRILRCPQKSTSAEAATKIGRGIVPP